MSKPRHIDIDLLRRALADAWPNWVTARELTPVTGYQPSTISAILGPAGRALNIEREWARVPGSGAKIMSYRLPSREAAIEMRPLKEPKPKKSRAKPKSQAAATFGHLSRMGRPTETKDIDPIRSLPTPTRRAVEWLRRDGWAIWPKGRGWQCGDLVLSERELVDLAERRQARAGG